MTSICRSILCVGAIVGQQRRNVVFEVHDSAFQFAAELLGGSGSMNEAEKYLTLTPWVGMDGDSVAPLRFQSDRIPVHAGDLLSRYHHVTRDEPLGLSSCDPFDSVGRSIRRRNSLGLVSHWVRQLP
jgi:hypothetical protein